MGKTNEPTVSIKKPKLDLFKSTNQNIEASYDNKTVLIEDIKLPPSQPRRVFLEDSIQSLADSILQHGILEPLIVRNKESSIELVSGERRLRAAKIAGLKEVPVVFVEADDLQVSEIRLVENLQREDLTPLDETEAILEHLYHLTNYAPEDVSKLLQRMLTQSKRKPGSEKDFPEFPHIQNFFLQLGRMTWQSFVRNRLPILNLPEDLLVHLRTGKLDYTKAKLINKIKNFQQRQPIILEVVEKQLSRVLTSQLVLAVLEKNKPTSITSTGDYDTADKVKSKSTAIAEKLKTSEVDTWSNTKLLKLQKLLEDIEGLLK